MVAAGNTKQRCKLLQTTRHITRLYTHDAGNVLKRAPPKKNHGQANEQFFIKKIGSKRGIDELLKGTVVRVAK